MRVINEKKEDYEGFANFKEFLTNEDWDKCFKDKNFCYSDPLQMAILRVLEAILFKLPGQPE